MASWKQVNEVGGTVVLRVIAGLFAVVALYGLVKISLDGHLSLEKAGMLLAFIGLMGGYALFEKRLRS